MTLSRRYKFLQTTLRSMWTKFRHHYLTELREHHMYTRRKTNSENVLKIGEVVIIKDDDVRSRCSWRLGRVESLVVGGDNQVRGANLRTISKEFRRTSMSRPLQKIIPLEVVDSPATPPSHPHSEDIDILPSNTVPETSTRSRRTCAKEGELRRRAMQQV